MSDYKYNAETNNYKECLAPSAPTRPAITASFKDSVKVQHPTRAEKESLRALNARACNIAAQQRLAAKGELVAQGCSFFKKQDIEELKEFGLRLAQQGDKNVQTLYLENINGHLRTVEVCALENAAHKDASLVHTHARVKGLANDPAPQPPAPVPLTVIGTPDDRGQNPARATIVPRLPASGPSAHPA